MRQLFSSQNSQLSGRASDSREVRGTLERITFYNEDNGYMVGRLLPEGAREVITITGTFSHPVIGEVYICHGDWTHHQQFGSQMQVKSHETVRPATSAAIEKYLGSGMVKGVGPVTAQKIVAKFGDRSLEVIEKSPDELLTVPGVGAKTVGIIKARWGEQSEVRGIMIFLQGHGVSPVYASKIYKTYERQTIEIVENNPYRLASDIWGIGFKIADKIARNLGFAEDDLRRLEAGVVYVLTQAVENGGDVYLTMDELVAECANILGPFDIAVAVEKLVCSGHLIREIVTTGEILEIGIYTPLLYEAERSLALHLLRLASGSVNRFRRPGSGYVAKTQPPSDSLSEEQLDAVRLAQESRVLVLTGGPGVGKTTTTNAIVRMLKEKGKRVLLASPTGRAAKRLSEVTSCDAVTVHRLLEFDPQRRAFQRNSESPLDCDVVLVDEASMLDTLLASALATALNDGSQLILVGDVDQLPSVGSGNVLRDIIDSGALPVVRLTKVFRQASQSMIISGAHSINSGVIPRLASPREEGADFIYVNAQEGAEVAEKIVAIVTRSLPKRGYALSDIQVLSPMQRGVAGSIELNLRLQQAINAPDMHKPELQRGPHIFRLGDRVIQLKNNYDKQVFNGDIGNIVKVNPAESGLTADFDGRQVAYEYAELDEVGLAYSLSIHKSQGSEFPVVVIALHTQHFTLLQRNLIYTALTRARTLAVLVGSKRALSMAVANNKQSERRTRLKERLKRLL